ncbi:Lipocalin-like domain-containing protein [Exophiala viscosa]|uniref:Lipocalin-like domain-containing protein n=1 Tax=Exophiala viscosa TaxID=2486360 RepID=A0AAN6DVF7_9EURO|nr:Lipocalin-like domain-containing protein [Exophiala viscosa]
MATNVFDKHSDKLAGVWNLISFEMFDMDNPHKVLHKPHGDEPLGKVVISTSGYLSAILRSPLDMKPLENDEWIKASDEEVLHAVRSLSCYAGPMTLLEREDGGFLWHTQVEISHNPNWIGKAQTRNADYSEEDGQAYMTLRPVTPYSLKDGRKTRPVLKWKKISK